MNPRRTLRLLWHSADHTGGGTVTRRSGTWNIRDAAAQSKGAAGLCKN